MKKIASWLLAGLLGVGLAGVAAAPASATSDHEGVCSSLDTGHLYDAAGPVHTIGAQEGKLIAEVCVKAGSVHNGNGPEYTEYDPAVGSLEISHSSGKDISHYSVRYVDAPVVEEPEVPVKPEPVVYFGEWGVGSVDCETGITTEGRWVWTHDWTLVDNVWVENATGVETSETRERPATAEECPIVDPEPIVVEGAPSVTLTHPTCDAPFNTLEIVLPDGLDLEAGFEDDFTIVFEEFYERELLVAHFYGKTITLDVVVEEGYSYDGPTTVSYTGVDPESLECDVVIPPTEEPVDPTTPPVVEEPKLAAPAAAPVADVTPKATELAETGYDASPIAWMAALGLVVAGGVLAALGIRRRATK